jgi:hypothetical protein
MAGTLKKLRFKVAWKNYRVGDIITPSGVLRDWLINNGYAVVEESSPVRAHGVNRQTTASTRRAHR